MKHTICTIYDCEFDDDIGGVIIGNTVYALDENNKPVPAKEHVCEPFRHSMVQFYIGIYSSFEEDTTKWGYFNWLDGKVVIPPMYDMASSFYYDRAMVRKNGKYGFLDPYGELIVSLIWDEAKHFSHGLCPVKKRFLWGYINENGAIVLQPRLEFAGSLEMARNGVSAALVKKDGKFGYIDNKGCYIFEPFFDDARKFGCLDLAAVMIRGVWGFIDIQGNFAVALQFEEVSDCNTYWEFYAVRKDGKWGIMDRDLNVIMPENGVRYAIYGDKRIYLDGETITSIRKISPKNK